MKYVAVALLISCGLYAQAPSIEWMRRYGAANALNFASDAITTFDGGLLIGGYSDGGVSGTKTQPEVGLTFDYWIVKTDAEGNVEWDKTFGGGGNIFDDYTGEFLTSLSQTTDGGYLLGGYSDSPIFGDKTEASFGDYDFWIVKLDANGNFLWDRDFGGTGSDRLLKLKSTPDGGCIAVGASSSGISGNKTTVNMGSFDYWILKLNANGVLQWQQSAGGDNWDAATEVVLLDDGYIVGGTSMSGISGNKTVPSKGEQDFWLIKLNMVGDVTWQKEIGGSGGDILTDANAAGNGFIFGGNSSSGISGDKTESARGQGDYWIVKTDNIGNVLWDRTYGGSDSDYLGYIQLTPDGGFVITGSSFSGVSGDKTESVFGESDTWTIRTDANGIMIWQKDIGGLGGDGFGKVFPQTDGSFIFAGTTNSPISGDITTPGYGGVDYWLVKTQPENLAAPQFDAFQLAWFADAEGIYIETADAQLSDIALYDVTGRRVAVRVEALGRTTAIRFGGAPGLYMLTVRDARQSYQLKIVRP